MFRGTVFNCITIINKTQLTLHLIYLEILHNDAGHIHIFVVCQKVTTIA